MRKRTLQSSPLRLSRSPIQCIDHSGRPRHFLRETFRITVGSVRFETLTVEIEVKVMLFVSMAGDFGGVIENERPLPSRAKKRMRGRKKFPCPCKIWIHAVVGSLCDWNLFGLYSKCGVQNANYGVIRRFQSIFRHVSCPGGIKWTGRRASHSCLCRFRLCRQGIHS